MILPFKDYLKLVQSDNTVDPFDTLEMIGPVNSQEPTKTPSPGPELRSRAHRSPVATRARACWGRKGQEQGEGRRKGESQGGGCEAEHACSERAEGLKGIKRDFCAPDDCSVPRIWGRTSPSTP